MEGIDIIGDVHGMHVRLVRLLGRLGYRRIGGTWSHAEGRRLVFVGDYIDGGDRPKEAVELVGELCNDGVALALAGNHDTNAVAFCMRSSTVEFDGRAAWLARSAGDAPGWLRPHSEKNLRQHAATLAAFQDPVEYEATVRALMRLPIWLELPSLRVVHAAWVPQSIAFLERWCAERGLESLGIRAESIDEAIQIQRQRQVPDVRHWHELLRMPPCARANELRPDANEQVALERIVKGVELDLPDGLEFTDGRGHPQRAIRIRWFDAARDRTYHEHALMRPGDVADLRARLPAKLIPASTDRGALVSDLIPFDREQAYGAPERPVLFGHYALFDRGDPAVGKVLAPNVACVDLGAAYEGVGGRLAAYRWSGERSLCMANFVDDGG